MNWEQYCEWSTRYAAMFGMTRDTERAMFVEWFNVFTTAGYTLAELNAATQVIGMDPPRFRDGHLRALHDAIRNARVDRVRNQQREVSDERGTCTTCRGVGMVCGMPHPDHIGPEHPGGYGATCVVYCHCPLGTWKVDQWESRPMEFKDKHKRTATMAEYTARVPDWRGMMERMRRYDQSCQRARSVTEEADKAGPLDAVMNRLRRKIEANAVVV